MRISDWSSDVCSSDLASAPGADRVEDLLARMTLEEKVAQLEVVWTGKTGIFDANYQFDAAKMAKVYPDGIGGVARPSDAQDRKSVVEGTSVSVRVDLGGRRSIKKKKT